MIFRLFRFQYASAIAVGWINLLGGSNNFNAIDSILILPSVEQHRGTGGD